MKEKTCCIIGHKAIPIGRWGEFRDDMSKALEAALDEGYNRFLCGFDDGADMAFMEALYEHWQQREHDFYIEAILPYRFRLIASIVHRYAKPLLATCHHVYVMEEKYYRGIYKKRNKLMLQESSLVIAAYDGRKKGDTKAMIEMAQEAGIPTRIVPIAPVSKKPSKKTNHKTEASS
ncbi:MAG: hypothetical protein U0M15_07370 [Bacillota bacterium]|nr:hypothetical protein [Bacillota bacterium]